jgi:hypothetical protein
MLQTANIAFFERLLVFSIVVLQITHANPKPPMPEITEIAVNSTLDWTVEVDVSGTDFYDGTGGSTDVLTFGFFSHVPEPPAESLKTSYIPVEYDSTGIALLTFNHYYVPAPWQFQYGDLVCVGQTGQKYMSSVQMITQLDSGKSYMRFSTEPHFRIVSCPSIGLSNGTIIGCITGTVTDSGGVPFNNLQVDIKAPEGDPFHDITGTNTSGFFSHEVVTCRTYLLSFRDLHANFVSDTIIGPLVFDESRRIELNVMLAINPVAVNSSVTGTTLSMAPEVKVLSMASTRGSPLVIIVSGAVSAVRANCDIFTLDGAMLCSLPFTINGPGTYTIPWKFTGNSRPGASTPATYVCRVRIDEDIWCKAFFTR